MSSKGQVTETANPGRMIRPVAISVALGAVISIAILLLFSALVSSRNIPQSAIDPMSLFAIGLGAFSSGLICAKAVRKNGLICGAVCGIAFSFIILVCSAAVAGNGLGLGALIKVVIMLICAMIGGILGVNTKTRKK